MWLKALTPIKVLPTGKDARARIVREGDQPFEIDDEVGAHLVAERAAQEVAAPAPAVPATGGNKAVK